MKINGKITPQELFSLLYKEFGPQNWWPADSPFEVIIGAILTQNTTWTNVEKAMYNLKSNNLLTPHHLEALSEHELGLYIKPTGYFNQKAKKIKAFLKFFKIIYNNKIELMSKETPEKLRSKLLSVNGVGEETADCILLYALKLPSFVVDAYTRRILDRIGLIKKNDPYNSVKKMLESSVSADAALYNEFHALLVKFGKLFCKKTPLCTTCPLQQTCLYFHTKTNKLRPRDSKAKSFTV